ncbi:DNA/RNA helicase, superfamily II [Beggiatoa alba B18LD]|uniref:DNA/RNA helicase, superfamily II n=1 Tax=Beggiatoa alba B18LD TaxID=395493 RepID=I3CKG2_9GAMM|nr:helicase-related protein [Beggiatoa alba]EIJ44105.1 DNA/RNA helicase, superfamily II [Beggiatoa alba B18LD]
MSSKFFTNSHERNLFDKFKGIIHDMTGLHAFHAVIGYFRSSGYFALQPYLTNVKEIHILIGINVDHLFAEAQRKGLLYFGDVDKAKDEFLRWFIQDIKEAKYSKEVEDGILIFINDLIKEKIKVRAHHSKTVHAKFYLFLPEHHTPHSDGWVIMGSSNLTEAGLGIKKTANYELNIALKDFDDVKFLKDEFSTLWEQATEILPADIQRFKEKTHIGQSFTPYELYIRFLIEFFGKNIDYDPDTIGDLPKTYKKLSYQIDAVNQGFQMLIEHNGFFLADVVGLGKTIVAAMIAKRFLIANGSLNTKILVVYPPTLEKNWKNTFRQFGIDRHAKFITNGRLEKIIKGEDLNYWAKEDYDLILVDEAHRYRNHKSTMFNNLQQICKTPRNGEGLIQGTKKKVILISATPLNNRPQDLYYQLLLFQDARKSTLPITNLQNFFSPIIRDYQEIMLSSEPDIEQIRKLYSLIREKIISQITVRRTRKDLKNYPKYLEDLNAQHIVFPEIAAPRPKIYELSTKLSKLFYRTVFYLTDADKINYTRYQATAYLKPELREQYYEQAVTSSKSLAGIMKTFMVKRLESSFTAFKKSLNNLETTTQRMIQMFEMGKILIAPDLQINDLMEKGFSIDEIETLIMEVNIDNPKNNVFTPYDFENHFIEGLQKDAMLLQELIKEWSAITEDPKLDTFFKVLDEELLNSIINPTGQLVIFTESVDTADYLQEKLEKRLKTKVLNVSADNRSKLFETIQENFDANYTGERKETYKILVTTDVLAEGINLHRCNVIVNYDTPWNATRLMQRIGRVNRIGSIAGVIYNYNFYPSKQGDEEIKLYNTALIKLQGFHTAFGEDAQIYTHEEMLEQFELFKEGTKDDEDKRLYYLRFIREFKDNNPQLFKRIAQFPMKARTARKVENSSTDNLAQNTIIFLKSPYKIEFYKVDNELKTNALSFLEAAQYFEANVNEPSFDLPIQHYAQVEAALQTFEQDFLSTTLEKVTKNDGVISAKARKFLRDMEKSCQQEEAKIAYINLLNLIDKGTITNLPTEMNKIIRQLDKKLITNEQVSRLIIKLAKKYNVQHNITEENPDKLEATPEPNIILSETFIE